MQFGIGQIISQSSRDYTSAAVWCNAGNGLLTDLGNGTSRIDEVKQLTLEETKTDLHNNINALRDEKEQDYFVYDGSKFDADTTSAQRLSMASQTASTALAAGQPFQLAWTLKDNTTRIMTAQNMIEVIPAFAVWSNAVHTYASALKAQVTNAVTIEELNVIDVEAGWPTPEQVAGV